MNTHNATKSPFEFGMLNKADQEKKHAFHELRVGHKKLNALMEDLMLLLQPHSESNIIALTGATGTGKSTMARKLLIKLADQFAPELATDKSVIPLVMVEAYANGERQHSFKPLFQDIRDQLMEPGVNRKTSIEIIDGRMILTPSRRDTVASLRQIVENALKYRKTRVCVIDEAYHLVRFCRETAVMDTLKSLANTTGVKLVLIGSFDLFDLVAGHGQIARRISILNLDRYHLELAEDRVEFKGIIHELMKEWPCEEVPNFESISYELLDATFGCVGLLKSFMLDAASMQLRNHGRWDNSFLKKSVKSMKLRNIIGAEIEVGEAKVRGCLFGESSWDASLIKQICSKMEEKNNAR